MAEAAGDEFGNILNSMLQLKPPGVSGSKIKAITELCVENVQSESVLIQKLYTHFKRAPGTHKLGVLYVVDSIVRAYIDEARRAGQDPSLGGPDGTFAAGIHRVTDILSSLMNDIMQHAPEDTKEKIKKLVDIWQRGSTFPSDLIDSIRAKHFSSTAPTPNTNLNGSAPDSAPAATTYGSSQSIASQPAQTAGAPNTAAILQALAQMSKQTAPPAATSSAPAIATAPYTAPPPTQPVPTNNQMALVPPLAQNPMAAYGSNQVTQTGAPSLPPNLQNLLPNLLSGLNNNQPTQPVPQMPPQIPFNMAGAPNLGGFGPNPDLSQQLALVQMLTQTLQGPQLAQVLESMGKGMGQQVSNMNPQQFWPQQPNNNYNLPDNNYNDNRGGPFSPSRERRQRSSRSRSPPYRNDDAGTVRRRSPIYGEYDANSGSIRDREYAKQNRGGRDVGYGSNGRNNFQRDRSGSPERSRGGSGGDWSHEVSGPNAPKYIDWDSSLKPDRIRVLSRTLFVGGVSTSDDELRALFQQFGDVQSCIVNYEKRHAFIKMKTRQGAERAKDGMETHKQNNFTLRTRWGVGFGPRDCSDYQTGISIIPIDRLTDADKRWMLTAEYGGTGGRPMEPGMVIEEPDIEIGQGVSSKVLSQAIGRRNPSDGYKGQKFQNRNDNYRDRDRYGSSSGSGSGGRRDYDNYGGGGNNMGNNDRDNGSGIAPPTPVFGLNFAGANVGMPYNYQGQQGSR